MPFTAAIGGAVASVAGGAIAASGAKKAAKAQSDAANKATDTQLRMFETTREDLAPFKDTGTNALYSLADLYGLPTPLNPQGGQPFDEAALAAFQRSPDYQVAKREGIGALDASAASKGLLLSGRQIKAVEDYGADLGSKNFGNYVNRLASLAGSGQNAAAQTGSFASSTARGVADTQLAAGEAQASGIVGGFNALSGGIQDAFKGLGTNYLAGVNPSSYVSPGINIY